MPPGSERAIRRRLTVALACAGLLLAASPEALAQAGQAAGRSAPAQSDERRGAKASQPARPGRGGAPSQRALTPSAVGPPPKDLGASGQVDPISGLGIRNPVCDRPGQIRARRTRLSCRLNGTPESTYPASNYGFDVWIDAGIDAPAGNFATAFVMALNGIWLGLAFVLKLILALLGLAFGLNPFAEGETMREIAAAVGRVYRHVTDPWLSALVVCGGIWFSYKGLIRREVAAGVGGTLAAVALLIVGLWVVHAPRESVGRLAKLSDRLALAVIAAPQSGSLARPAGNYAEAMSRTWSGLVEVPFAGLNFSDVEWALGPPPAEAVERADAKFCADVGAIALLSILSRYDQDEAADACAGFARRRYGEPKRVIDLYLRSSPGSPARRELWQYFDKDESERFKAKVAAQGGDGVLTRLSMLALFAAGLLGAILLLAWLAIRLFTQASIGFVLLMVAPFALFFPLLGDSGRRAFKTWGLTLLGAIAAKVIYAALLAVVLMGMGILGRVGGATGFMLSCAFAWSIFLRRAELIGWLSIGNAEPSPTRGLFGQLAGVTMARSLGGGVAALAGGVASAGRGAVGRRVVDGGAAVRATARDSLRDRAKALADHRYVDATRVVTQHDIDRHRPSSERPGQGAAGLGGQAEPRHRSGTVSAAKDGQVEPGNAPRSGSAPADAAPGAQSQKYERARKLIRQAESNERTLGRRWSDADLDRFAVEDRELLRNSTDPADHAHRIGIDRSRFEALRAPDRERAEEEIEKARLRDRRRLDVAEGVPGRVVGRPRQAVEGLRQRSEGGGHDRREHLRRLRRDRRAERLSRRGVSRGA